MSPSEILCELISIPSVNPMGTGKTSEIHFETRMSDHLEATFRDWGIPYERIEVAPGRANVLARYDSSDSKGILLLDVHQDTVPVDGMTIEPFRPILRHGTITGRGAADVKGSMAAMLHAFSRLIREKKKVPYSVVLCCSCDEESTLMGVRDLVTYWEKGATRSRLLTTLPSAAIVAEPTELDIVVAHRGVVRSKIRTLGRACHSSDPTQGVNAIYAMARVVSQLEELAGSLSQHTASHPRCGSATLSVGRIEGGVSVNVVPDQCWIEVDRRVIPGESPARAFQEICQVATAASDRVVCDSPWISAPALHDDRNLHIGDNLSQHLHALGIPSVKKGVPYCTNASTISEHGVPTIVFGPGSIAQAHTVDEYISVEQLDQAAEIYYRFCCQPGELDSPS